MPKAAVMFLMLLTLGAASARGKDAEIASASGSDCYAISFGDYEPQEPKSLKDLPPVVRRKLYEHLVDRLGEAFAARLVLRGGQIIDIAELYRIHPVARDYQWTIPSFVLGLSFSVPARGIADYCSSIELSKDGDVVREIRIPPVRRLPQKQNFVSLRDVLAKARHAGFDPKRTAATLGYDEAIESITYHLEQRLKPIVVRGNTYGDIVRWMDVDAHSGRMLRLQTEKRWE
jgi:hypothetical protein